MQSQEAEQGRRLAVTITSPSPRPKRKDLLLKLVLSYRLAKPARAEWQIINSEGGVGPDGRLK